MRSGASRVVAVLGATGCVGGHVCDAVSRAGYEVLAVARHYRPRSYGRRFVPLDVAAADPGQIAGLFDREQVGAVVNATGGWLETAAENEYHHVRLVERLLAGTALMRRQPRIVQVGSIHEYGPLPYGVSVSESAEPKPETPYARTKLAGSQAVLDATCAGRADGVVLRVVNVCGPFVSPASFLGQVIDKLRRAEPGQRVEFSVDGSERDFVDVRDVAEAVLRAVRAPVAGEVINIGRGEAVAMRRLLSLLVSVTERSEALITQQEGRVESRGGTWVQADIRLAGKLLEWRPQIALPDSFADMWAVAKR